jgi:Zn-dependent protease with chaperone function
VEDALLRWLRAAELTCDRAALLVAQDPAVVIGALMKLAGGSPAFAHELSVDAFLQQVGGFTDNGSVGIFMVSAFSSCCVFYVAALAFVSWCGGWWLKTLQ